MARERSNSMVMLLTCSRLWLVRVLMPSMLLISSSSRSLTSVSTTAALSPGYTVVTLTSGGSMSGNSRTGRRDRPMTPKRMSARLIIVARMGRWMLILGRTISGRFQIRRRRLRRRKCHFRSRPDLLHALDDNFFPGLQAAYLFYLAGGLLPGLEFVIRIGDLRFDERGAGVRVHRGGHEINLAFKAVRRIRRHFEVQRLP